jgi:hypothetical protein
MNKRNSLLEFAMGALMGAVLIVVPAASGQNDTQTPAAQQQQPPSTQLPQDQSKDQQESMQGDRATPQSSGDEDRMGLQPPNTKEPVWNWDGSKGSTEE